MGCYLVKVNAAYIRGELNFQSDAQIYKKDGCNTREKLIEIIWRKINVKASQCYHYFVSRRGFRTVYNSQYWSIFRMQCFHNHLKFLVD